VMVGPGPPQAVAQRRFCVGLGVPAQVRPGRTGATGEIIRPMGEGGDHTAPVMPTGAVTMAVSSPALSS
jgi:hypothetical protein